ncbi:chemotaxis-specific protein-glutamate methyltransferase CheB [Pseudochryseolinea flava]|uniref:Protein-glutamate methylesterase/protein-glutamine glutaminase n=1 Tax=Pseudochryseolinea flava TaxID=2059302 RepID=A0A364Y2M9_9BACT|nr:chemotaxis-specific protein-glutamate methyltransferase CheB [Pseudochryseolinea flava]RAW01016.1 chemotaxis response regulator protein-glutamate methylesterase [Pseudochryseolinea flava]
MSNRIRTLLIEDSAFMRKVIGDIITSDADIDLVGTAADGKEGSDMFLALKPDVVVTDMVMPEYDGMYVVRSVMENRPVPVILLSSLEKTSQRIFDALQGGAFEFIDKPSDLDLASIKNYRLLELIKEASKTDMSLLVDRQQSLNVSSHTFSDNLHYEIVAIGASTGGPGAIEMIINNLPKNLQVPVVIAQHMPARFLETFAHRLNEHSELSIRLAKKGEMLRGGTIYIAPGEHNIRIERNLDGVPVVGFTTKKYEEFNYPSVNCLFESVAEVYGNKSIGVILTGMGKDGMNGLKKIFQRGGYTIAQDEESSIVYGMPKAAVENGAVKQTVRLKEIAGFIISCL